MTKTTKINLQEYAKKQPEFKKLHKFQQEMMLMFFAEPVNVSSKSNIIATSRQFGKTLTVDIAKIILNRYNYSHLSNFDIVKTIINRHSINEVVERKHLIQCVDQASAATIDNYRRLLTVTGYLKSIAAGKYQVMKHVENDMTTHKLKILANGTFYFPRRERAEKFHELSLLMKDHLREHGIGNCNTALLLDYVRNNQEMSFSDMKLIDNVFTLDNYAYAIKIGLLTKDGKSRFYETN